MVFWLAFFIQLRIKVNVTTELDIVIIKKYIFFLFVVMLWHAVKQLCNMYCILHNCFIACHTLFTTCLYHTDFSGFPASLCTLWCVTLGIRKEL